MFLSTPEDIVKTFAAVTGKLAGGFNALKKIETIDVGTAPKEVVWKNGKVALYCYNGDAAPKIQTPVLVVYALVNRHSMMDIEPERSFIRNLRAAGMNLYMIDWGYPTPEERYYTLNDYINGYINDAIDVIREQTGRAKVTLMGICQGGTFSIIYAALHAHKIKNLITLVTPVDFQTPNDRLSLWARHLDVDTLVDGYGNIPGAVLNAGFEMLKPMLKTNKYVSILNSVDKEAQLLNFLRMEYWIADSPSQAGECFRQFIKELYQQNKLMKGTLELGGKTVQLKNITMPLLNIYATEDHLVPPEASMPLNDLVGSTDTCLTKFSGGHIGVFVGSRSQRELAPGITEWLKERDYVL